MATRILIVRALQEMPPSSLEDNSTRIDYNTPGSDGAPEMIHPHLSEKVRDGGSTNSDYPCLAGNTIANRR